MPGRATGALTGIALVELRHVEDVKEPTTLSDRVLHSLYTRPILRGMPVGQDSEQIDDVALQVVQTGPLS